MMEICSKFYISETFKDYRKLCHANNLNYLVTYLNDGCKVDLVIDFSDDIYLIEKKLQN